VCFEWEFLQENVNCRKKILNIVAELFARVSIEMFAKEKLMLNVFFECGIFARKF